VRGSRRAAASCSAGHRHLALVDAGGGVLEGGDDVFALEVGVVLQHLLGGSAGGELAEHHADGDPEVADAGHAPHALRIDGDSLEGHAPMLRVCGRSAQGRFVVTSRRPDTRLELLQGEGPLGDGARRRAVDRTTCVTRRSVPPDFGGCVRAGW